MLDELLDPLDLKLIDYLLDVGRGTGRVPAYVAAKPPRRATGIELGLAPTGIVSAWTARFDRLKCALLACSTSHSHCYLFNHFDTPVPSGFP